MTEDDIDSNEIVPIVPVVSSMDEMLSERDKVPDNLLNQSPEEDKKEILHLKKNKEPEPEEPDVEEYDNDNEVEENIEDVEISRLNKLLTDSQKWGHSNQRKIKSVIKKVQSLVDEGILTEDDSKSISELMNQDQEEPQIPVNETKLDKILRVANKKVVDLHELFEDDEGFNQKVQCFDMLLKDASKDEYENIMDELYELENQPLKLAKKMYKMGEEYYESFYKDLHNKGGVKEYVQHTRFMNDRLQKRIDKLEKKLRQYESHDKAHYRIDELNDSGEEPATAGTTVDELFAQRDNPSRSRGYRN